MDRADAMAIGTILKFLLGLFGIMLTLIFLIAGLMKKDNQRLKKAGLIFIVTWIIIIVIGTIEFLILK